MALLFPCKKASGIGLASLVITTPPTTTTFAQYDTLDLTGLKVTATFKDGLVADVTDLCQITPADGSELSDYGNIDITIKYANKAVTQSITVNQMTAIAVTTQPTKTRYLVGENLDLTGIAVTATAGALTRDVTNLAEYDPPNGTQLNTQGTQRIDVEYGDASTYFNVTTVLMGLPKKIPYDFEYGSAVVYKNEIHVLGGSTDGSAASQKHYKWDGTNWVRVGSLPYTFGHGSAVVYNDEIHILGGAEYYSGSWHLNKNHYKWDGTRWAYVGNLPYEFNSGQAVVYNNEIHILGGGSSQYKHYKWDGTSWTSVSTMPAQNMGVGSAVVYNNEIHMIGGYTGVVNAHYKWDGTSWTQLANLPFVTHYYGSAVVYNNEIHALGGNNSKIHYKWNGTNWTQLADLPYVFYNADAVVFPLGGGISVIEILGTHGSNTAKNVASWDGTSWTVGTN